ncbi:MAG: hypothetical protein HY825_00665 [Acidobacteria bacterium]|nr:hypothetical protein [Acidobacteriota bacterium]
MSAALGVYLIFFTRNYQATWLWIVQRMPRWFIWPLRVDHYRGEGFLWLMRIVGLGGLLMAVSFLTQ